MKLKMWDFDKDPLEYFGIDYIGEIHLETGEEVGPIAILAKRGDSPIKYFIAAFDSVLDAIPHAKSLLSEYNRPNSDLRISEGCTMILKIEREWRRYTKSKKMG